MDAVLLLEAKLILLYSKVLMSTTLSVNRYITDFKVDYKEDSRTEHFDSWPETLDDSLAREQWGFNPRYGLLEITKTMLEDVRKYT